MYSPEKAKETVASYFERLYTPRQIEEEIISLETYINQKITEHALNKKFDCLKVNEAFTIKEVKGAMKVLKKRKARGPDDIPNEFMKEGGIVIQTILLNLFNRIWLQEDIPKEWSIAELVCLFKGKGDQERINNYRGISLSSNMGKLFERIINSRMVKIVNFTEAQDVLNI